MDRADGLGLAGQVQIVGDDVDLALQVGQVEPGRADLVMDPVQLAPGYS